MKNLVDKLVNSAFNFQMQTNYERILSGKNLDINNRPYNIKLIDNMINFFEEEEEYEKCHNLIKFKQAVLDHENNYYRYM